MTTPATDQAGHDQATVDAILDAALDELDDDSDDDNDDDDDENINDEANNNHSNVNVENSSAPAYQECSAVVPSPMKKVVFGPEKPPPPNEVKQKWQQQDVVVDPAEQMITQMMDQLMKDPKGFESSMKNNNPFENNDGMLEKMMYDMQLQLQQELSGGAVWGSNNTNYNNNSEPTRQTPTKKSNKSNNKEKKVVVSEAIANIVDEMSQPTSTSVDETTFEPPSFNPSADNMDFSEMNMFNGILKDMQEDIKDGKFDESSVLDGMMEQLLSKELMYEPIKQVATKFPEWLEQHKTILSPEEYNERSKQSEMFQNLVKLYETDSTNIPKLMECMQEIQEFGQPPVEIIKDIAPGIDLDEDGMPIFDSKSGLPPFFTQGGKDDDCSIM